MYQHYKSSGVEWLGDVPEHWKVLAIKRLSVVKRGASPRPIEDPKYFDDEGEYAWVRIADVTAANVYLKETTQRLSDLGSSLSVRLEPNSLFVSIAGTVGKPSITGTKACIHDGFVYFPDLKGESKFLFYIFDAGEAYKGLGKLGTQLNLNTETIGAIKIGYPPNEERTAIVTFLDREIAKIDRLIAKQERLIELLGDKRQSVISHAVTRGVNPDAPMKDSGIEWLGEIPAHWKVLRNKTIFREVDDRSITGHEELLSVSHLTGVTPRSEKTVYMFMAETLEGYKKCQPGDLIINTMWAYMGALGSTEYEGVVSPSYNVYRIREKGSVNPKYLDYLYRIPTHISEITRHSKGVWESRLRLYPDSFLSMNSPLPPRQEQDEIVSFLDLFLRHLNELDERCRSAIELLQEHRTVLISAAVTGKIDVRQYAD